MSDVRLVATNPDDNTLVPVASNASGQLAVQSPKIEKVPNDFDVEGDLTVSGSASFGDGGFAVDGTGVVQSNINSAGHIKLDSAGDSSDPNIWLNSIDGSATFGGDLSIENSSYIRIRKDGDDTSTAIRLAPDGSAVFAGNVQVGGDASNSSRPVGTYLWSAGSLSVAAVSGQNIWNGYTAGTNTNTSSIKSDGDATFAGDVTVGSRNKQWMLVEQGGLCHMVEQVRASTADLLVDPAQDYPKLRDVFAELNVIEKALEEVMEKLRMTEPDGWPVWDGSSNS